MQKTEQNPLIRSPTLGTVLMVEKTIEEYSGEVNRTELWKKLPRKVMWQTYLVVLDYLEENNNMKVIGFNFTKISAEKSNKTDFESINTNIESFKLISCFLGFNNLKKHNPDLFISYSFPSNFLINNKKSKKINYINHFPHYLYLNTKEKLEWASGTQGIKRWISLIPSFILSNFLKKTDKKLVEKNNLNFMNSEFTKKNLNKLYKTNSIVSYPPLDPKFNIPSKNKINDKFIFSSSRIIPDKKYEWLLKSMSYMKNKIPLYLAGSVEQKYKEKLTALANKYNVKLKFLGRLNTEEIKSYYTNT